MSDQEKTYNTGQDYDSEDASESKDIITNTELKKIIDMAFEHFSSIIICYFDNSENIYKHQEDIKDVITEEFKNFFDNDESLFEILNFHKKRIILKLCQWSRITINEKKYQFINENFMLEYYLGKIKEIKKD